MFVAYFEKHCNDIQAVPYIYASAPFILTNGQKLLTVIREAKIQ